MKRLSIATMFAAAAIVLAAMGATSAYAVNEECVKVKPGEVSRFSNSTCTTVHNGTGEWILTTSVLRIGQGVVCALAEEAGNGNWKDADCKEKLAKGNFEEAEYKGFLVEMLPPLGAKKLKTASFAGSYVLLGKPFLVAVHIECTKVHVSGLINTGGLGDATLEFSSCSTTKPSNCTAKEPIVTEVNTELVNGTTSVENEFKPKSGTNFTTILLEGASCALKAEPFEVTGSQVCALPSGESEAVGHEIECKTAGSKLKAGGATATFEGTINGLELESGELWAAT